MHGQRLGGSKVTEGSQEDGRLDQPLTWIWYGVIEIQSIRKIIRCDVFRGVGSPLCEIAGRGRIKEIHGIVALRNMLDQVRYVGAGAANGKREERWPGTVGRRT